MDSNGCYSFDQDALQQYFEYTVADFSDDKFGAQIPMYGPGFQTFDQGAMHQPVNDALALDQPAHGLNAPNLSGFQGQGAMQPASAFDGSHRSVQPTYELNNALPAVNQNLHGLQSFDLGAMQQPDTSFPNGTVFGSYASFNKADYDLNGAIPGLHESHQQGSDCNNFWSPRNDDVSFGAVPNKAYFVDMPASDLFALNATSANIPATHGSRPAVFGTEIPLDQSE